MATYTILSKYPKASIALFYMLLNDNNICCANCLPGVFIIAPEEHWVNNFIIASKIWAVFCILFLFFLVVKAIIAMYVINKFPKCSDEKVLHKIKEINEILQIRKLPEVRFGELKEPACVASVFFPKIIINNQILDKLTEEELNIILFHELVHIKQRHLLMQRGFDLICCFHWFNPICWLARQEYYLVCELAYDKNTIEMLKIADPIIYANTMVKLMQLNIIGKKVKFKNAGLLDFLETKRRLSYVLSDAIIIKKAVAIIVSIIILLGALGLSIAGSRGYFYPYPAKQSSRNGVR